MKSIRYYVNYIYHAYGYYRRPSQGHSRLKALWWAILEFHDTK